jgi:hypothetical protein
MLVVALAVVSNCDIVTAFWTVKICHANGMPAGKGLSKRRLLPSRHSAKLIIEARSYGIFRKY